MTIRYNLKCEKPYVRFIKTAKDGSTYEEKYYKQDYIFTGYGCAEAKPIFALTIEGKKYEFFSWRGAFRVFREALKEK